MISKIAPAHHDRLACIYVRQSTIEQVRHNRESRIRQEQLSERAVQLGWSPQQVIVIDEDLGKSAAVDTAHRSGYNKLLAEVAADRVGVILAVEVSRLAREDIAWQIMFQHCHFGNVLLADESHVYDPGDSHDRLMLGLLATFASHELSVLRERMQQAWRQKAARGELYCGVAPGYVVERQSLIKTADQRVRHAIETILAQFPHHCSVSALCRWCCANGIEQPLCRDGYGRCIEWRQPDTESLQRLLGNPIYAGAYVMGRTQRQDVLMANGQIHKRTVKLPLEQWTVIHAHHEPYISWDQFLANYQRVCPRPVNQSSRKRTISHGQALLAGRLRCQRCGCTLQVRYGNAGQVRYVCLRGSKQRDARTRTCLSFLGADLDELIGQQVLEVVRPAGVEAALLAAEQHLASQRQTREVLLDRAEQCKYEADRAYRQFHQVEPENRLVAAELERRWEQRLSELQNAQLSVEQFDRREVSLPPAAMQEQLMGLGGELESVWFSPQAPIEVKKQIVALLIEHVVVDVSDEHLQVLIHWRGEHESEHRLARRRRSAGTAAPELRQCIDLLRLIANDEQIARMLNRAGIKTGRGATWTAQRVGRFRSRHSLAAFDPSAVSGRGFLRQDEAAERLGISAMSMHRLLVAGMVPGRQAAPGLPWVIEASALTSGAVQKVVRDVRSQTTQPAIDNDKQPSLWGE